MERITVRRLYGEEVKVDFSVETWVDGSDMVTS